MKISRLTARDLVKGSEGKIFTVTFTKKDGTERVLNGRMGVYKSKNAPLNGVGMNYNPDDYGLATVFDMQKQAYRTINLETVTGLKVDGEEYEVE